MDLFIQSVTTSSSDIYQLTFDAAARNDQFALGGWTVSLGAATYNTGVLSATQWQGYLYYVLGAGGASNLTFTGNKYSQNLSNVSLVDVAGACWSGGASGNLGGSDANFSGNTIAAALTVNNGNLYFLDTDGHGNTPPTSTLTTAPGGISPTALCFGNNSVPYTLNSSDATGVTGTTVLVKQGSGLLTMTGTNTYTGGTQISAGTLVAVNAASLPLTGPVSVASGASLVVPAGGAADWSGPQIDSLLQTATWANNTSTLGIDTTNGNFTYGTSITQGLALTKLGANTLTLTGSNTSYSGLTTIGAGALQLGDGAAGHDVVLHGDVPQQGRARFQPERQPDLLRADPRQRLIDQDRYWNPNAQQQQHV